MTYQIKKIELKCSVCKSLQMNVQIVNHFSPLSIEPDKQTVFIVCANCGEKIKSFEVKP
jgi:hypothetical protein